MADQTLAQQAARRDDGVFQAQVSAAVDLELLDIARGAGSWSGDTGATASSYARKVLSDAGNRAEALDMCKRIAAADLIAEAAPTDIKIRKAVRRAMRFMLSIPQEA